MIPGRPPVQPDSVITYIIRRLFAAVVLLFIVSVVTFAIFFLMPRLGGVDAGDPGHPVRRPGRDRGDGQR